MKHFEKVIQQAVIKLTCDGKQLSVDLCQHCFASRFGDVLTINDSWVE